MKRRLIRALVRLYPSAWRAEYGAEFADMLARMPMRMAMVVNVAANGAHERLLKILRHVSGGGAMEAQFHARYDRFTKIMTALVLVALISVPILNIGSGIAFWGGAVVTALVLGFGFAYSPRRYEIAGGALRVKRLAGDVVLPLDHLRYLRAATTEDFAGCVRLWGSGGLFGYYGTFWSQVLGRSQWYVTDRSKAVVIAYDDRVVVVSPDDRDAFVAAIGTGESLPPMLGESARGYGLALSLILGIAFAAAVLSFAGWALFANPGRPPIKLTRDSLAIDSKFYGMTMPASGVDVAHVRVVDLSTEPGWRPVIRTNGFGSLRYSAGSFRTANGRDIKLFTTGSKRLVLLPPSHEHGTPVLLDTADPDKFVAQVRAEWGDR